ncbi:MAG: hypothetical protein HYX41_06225 [Bdellovibrio sp.]|nr:hypothetical protein [Bdellovibrio sp.]
MESTIVKYKFEKAVLSVALIFGAFYAQSAWAGSQIDSMIRRFQPISAIHSRSEPSEFHMPVSPLAQRRGVGFFYSMADVVLNPVAPNADNGAVPVPAPSSIPDMELNGEHGFGGDVLRVGVGYNSPFVFLSLLPYDAIEASVRDHFTLQIQYRVNMVGFSAKDAFACKSAAANSNVPLPIDPFSIHPRHLLSAETLAMLEEIHNLPFETLFGFFVEQDTGHIVCKTLIRMPDPSNLETRTRTVTVINKGDTFEATFSRAIRKVIRDKDLLVVEDLARSQPSVFSHLLLEVVRRSLLPSTSVLNVGRLVQMNRSGQANDPAAIDALYRGNADVPKTQAQQPSQEQKPVVRAARPRRHAEGKSRRKADRKHRGETQELNGVDSFGMPQNLLMNGNDRNGQNQFRK